MGNLISAGGLYHKKALDLAATKNRLTEIFLHNAPAFLKGTSRLIDILENEYLEPTKTMWTEYGSNEPSILGFFDTIGKTLHQGYATERHLLGDICDFAVPAFNNILDDTDLSPQIIYRDWAHRRVHEGNVAIWEGIEGIIYLNNLTKDPEAMMSFLSGILEEICDQVDEKGIEGAYGYIVGNLLPDFLLCFVGVGELNMAAKAAKATEAAEKARSTKWGRGAAAGAKTSGEAAKLRGFGRFGELIADFGEWNKLPVFVTPEGFTMKGDAAGRFFADFKEFRQVKNAERMAAVDDIAAGGKKLTGPSKTPDPHAKPTGNPEKIDPKWNEQKIRGIEAENETAEIFAKNGYEIEQRPKVLESDGVSLDKKPDYTIIEEGVRAAKAAGEPVAQNIINLASKDFASTDMKMFRLSNELTGIADLLINDFTGVGTQKHTAR